MRSEALWDLPEGFFLFTGWFNARKKLMTNWKHIAGLIAILMATAPLVVAAADEDYEYDPYNAEEIMELCAGCHGEFGQGGGDGEYPRLAGLPLKYLEGQLRAYISGEREGLVMMAYANEREMPETDLRDISRYLAEIELPSKMPIIDQDLDSLEKLLIASRVFNVPRHEGDPVLGEQIYNKQCKMCHGKNGGGRGKFPQLAGQYSDYIRLQIKDFRSGKRINKQMDKYLAGLTEEHIDNLLAYLSVADD